MLGKIAKYLAGLTASAIAWWLISLGGGITVGAVVGEVSGMNEPWIYVFVAGVVAASTGTLLMVLRVATGLALSRWPSLFGSVSAPPERISPEPDPPTPNPAQIPLLVMPESPKPPSLYERLEKAHRKGTDLVLDARWNDGRRSRQAYQWYLSVCHLIPREYRREFDAIVDERELSQDAQIRKWLDVIDRVMKDPKHR